MLFDRVRLIYATLSGAGLVMFALAWIPNDSSLGWLATIGWNGFMLAVIGLVAYTIALRIRRVRRSRSVEAR